MFSLYARVAGLAGRRGLAAWPAAFSLVVYGLIAWGAAIVAAPLGIIGGILLTFVWAACWSSYLELISQAVEGTKIRLRIDDLRRTFLTRFWDVVSVMFAFWIIGFVAKAVTSGANGDALGAILGFAMAFFFNAVPELLYQGGSRSFALLLDSGRFMTAHYLVWLPPNLVFAAAALAAGGRLHFHRPAEALLLFANTFSSPVGSGWAVHRAAALGAPARPSGFALRHGVQGPVIQGADCRFGQRAAAGLQGLPAPLRSRP